MEDVNKYADMVQALAAAYGLKIIAAIVIFIIGKWLSGLLSRAVGKAMERAKAEQVLVKFVVNLAYAALLAFVVLAALAQLGIQTTSFIALWKRDADTCLVEALFHRLRNLEVDVPIIGRRDPRAHGEIDTATAGIL